MALTILKIGRFDMLPELKAQLEQRGTYYVDNELTPIERAEIRSRTDIVVASGGSSFTEEDFATCPKLRAIVCFSVGYDRIDIKAAIAHNVFVTHTPDVLNDDVANTAMMLMLNCTRQFKEAQDYIERDAWGHEAPFPLTTSICRKKIGIAGLGRIGREIAARAAAFKMKIGYYGRHRQDGVDYEYFGSLKELAQWCDVLVLAMPATPENYHCVNYDILKALGPRGFLINIARGSLVDTTELINALDQGMIAGAGLDVFEQEPGLPRDLCHRPNVALLPHLGSATNETRNSMAELVIANLDAILEEREVITPVPGTRTI